MTENEKSIIDLAQETGSPQSPPMGIRDVGPDPNAKANADEQLAFLLEKVKDKQVPLSVTLPSKGAFYNNFEGETVTIRPMTFSEERKLKSATTEEQGKKALQQCFEGCVEGVPFQALTIPDKNFVMFKIREISYGSTYPLETTCTQCGVVSRLKLELSSLEVTYLKEPEKAQEVLLPDADKLVHFRVPRVHDEDLVNDIEGILGNLHVFVKDIGGIEDKGVIRKFIESTTVRDVDTLRMAIFNLNYGLENELFFECIKCGANNRAPVSLNESFFTAS